MSANVDVFEVGVQQVKDFAAVNFYPGGLGGCFDGLREGMYLVVECSTHFGCTSTPWVFRCFTLEKSAVEWVLRDDAIQNNPDYMLDHDPVIGYEVWHVVDDFDLWANWVIRVREVKIESQRKAGACRISLNNGLTFLDPVRDEGDMQDLIVFLDMYPHKWDLIVSCYMDDETREFTHLTSSYTGMLPDEYTSTAKINACWLCDYLMNADSDLIC